MVFVLANISHLIYLNTLLRAYNLITKRITGNLHVVGKNKYRYLYLFCSNNKYRLLVVFFATIIHLKTALFKSSCYPALTFFLFKLIVPEESSSIIHFLFAEKSRVKIVFLGTSYLGCLLSISCNTLTLSSMKALYFFGDVDIFLQLFLKQSKKLNSFGKA